MDTYYMLKSTCDRGTTISRQIKGSGVLLEESDKDHEQFKSMGRILCKSELTQVSTEGNIVIAQVKNSNCKTVL